MIFSSEVIQRFWVKVDRREANECWPWKACLTDGYGYFKLNGHKKAHRIAYELLVGPIPDGLTLDHLCRNRQCVNPSHLEPVTVKENLRRGFSPSAMNKRKAHCLNGHPLSGSNLYLHKRGRACRTCQRDRSK